MVAMWWNVVAMAEKKAREICGATERGYAGKSGSNSGL
jgi:hypothetical protein